MKPFYLLLLAIVATATASAQNTYVWNAASGSNWNASGSWNPARTTPATNDILVFNTGATLAVNNVPTETIGRLEISNNSVITLNGTGVVNTLTIGSSLAVLSGTLNQTATLENVVFATNATANISGAYTNFGAFNISAAGVVVTVNGSLDNRLTLTGASATSLVVNNGGTFYHGINGGIVPTATWNDGSTLNLRGMTSAYPTGGMNQTFKGLVFSGGLTANLIMNSNINCQDLTISITGSELRLTDDASDRIINVGRDFTQTSGTFVLVSDDGDGTLNVTRNASISGGTLRVKDGAGAGRFNVTGNFSQSAGTVDLWASNTASNSIANVTGDFSMTGGTFDICGTSFRSGALNVAGNFSLTAGTITETGTSFSTGVVTFDGTDPQTYVSGGNVNNTVNFVVSSGAILQMDAAGTTVGGDDFTLSSGGTLGIRSADGITVTGATGNIRSGGTRFYSAGANYIYNGSANQAVGAGFPTNLTGSLTIDNANTVTLGLTRTIASGGDVYLTNGTFATAGTMTMATGSTITRSGGSITGNIAGTGAYTAIYTGNTKTSGPELSGSALANITLNTNAAQVVTLNQAKTITGALTLTNGILSTTGTNLLTIGTGGSASAGSDNSFVNGPLAKNTNSTALFTFPVGVIGNGIRPVGVKPAATTATTYTSTFLVGNPRTAYPGATLAAGLTQISYCEYWTVNRSAGGANANVTLSWSANSCSGAGYVGNPVTLKVARHDGGAPGIWTDAGNSGSTGTAPFASGTVTSALVSSFSPFVIGTGNNLQNPLPVMFADVKAYAKNSGIQVEWSNLTERELLGYVVERSADGTNFTAIGAQAPRGNNNDKESYSHFDASPVTGSNFYRIRVNEMHGKIIYSKVLRVDIGTGKQSFGMYPNPVTGRQFTVSLNGMTQGQYSLKVVNAIGQPVFETKINNVSSATTQTLELPASVKSGVYTSILTGADYRETKMFIVQ